MSIQQKLLRKFFYENSANIEDLAIFAEINNVTTARKVGINRPDEMVVIQNSNQFTSEEGNKEEKVLNLAF
jgi:hypothetical protein